MSTGILSLPLFKMPVEQLTGYEEFPHRFKKHVVVIISIS